ncbi:MAG: hypothetical protein GF390_00930, partial [Candidatus Pacebacteria bacterium]|nr:hypothetical protein [Candidatus Paceibacterota bacterium]
IRHTGELVDCELDSLDNQPGVYQINLSKPLSGIAAGQFAVFYAQCQSIEQYVCLGGATIQI